jgi:hypothetical protein
VPDTDRRQIWFDRGCEAFKRSRPKLAAQVPWARFYVCPLCITAFNELTLTDAVDPKDRLTDEHVPPESAGGKKMLLTCSACNWRAGTEVDSHMRREADAQDFFLKGNLREIKADVLTDSGRVPIRLSLADFGIKAVGIKKAVKPETHKNVMGDFEKATIGDGWKDFTFKIELPTYSPSRADTSWLRSAYLAFFATLGYHFILRRELDIVRDRIQNPMLEAPRAFKLTRREESEPLLGHIDAPEVLRSYVMFYGRNMVFLPRYGDHTLYERLAGHPETNVSFEGKQYPWPSDGPTFLDDDRVE